MIAKIMLPIPVGRPFDYLVPEEMKSRIRKGMRVCVPFCRRQRMGYVVGFSSRSAVKGLRSIGALPDNVALLGRTEFAIAEYIAASYFCSLGQALELTLPLALRKGRRIDTQDCPLPEDDAAEEAPGEKGSVFLLQGLSCARWRFYRDKIAAALSQGRRAIVLCPDIDACRRMQAWLEKEFKVAPSLLQGRLGPRRELEEWLRIKRGKADIVLGTCSAVFVPLRRLGLIIVEQEQEAVYKQEQSPFYDARDVAVFRGRQAGADVVLSSNVPTLESYYLARKGRYRLVAPGQEGPPDPAAQVVEMKDEYYRRGKRRVVISSILENAVRNTLREGRRVVLFLNRVGFSTYALCRGCGFIIRCQHCSNNLTYIFASRSLVCRSCNFSIRPPERCPRCNAAYIRYLGLGTEKLESEACRLFPKARVERYDRLRRLDLSKERFDILVATQIILNDPDNLKGVGLLGLVDMDVSLNHIDFRAAEKTFQVVSRLLSAVYRPRQGHDFSGGGENGAGPQGEGCRAIIQTRLSGHYIIKPLVHNDYREFYRRELRQRRELSLPPLSQLAEVNIRGKKQQVVASGADSLFSLLARSAPKSIEVFSPVPAIPPKIRGNLRYGILLKSRSRKPLVKFLNKNLRGFKRSPLTISVNVAPR